MLVPRIFKNFTVCSQFCFDFGCLLISKREDLQQYSPRIRDNINLYFSIAAAESLTDSEQQWDKPYPKSRLLHLKVMPKDMQVEILVWDARGDYAKTGRVFHNEEELFDFVNDFFSDKQL